MFPAVFWYATPWSLRIYIDIQWNKLDSYPRENWVGRAVTHIEPMLCSWTDLRAPSIQTFTLISFFLPVFLYTMQYKCPIYNPLMFLKLFLNNHPIFFRTLYSNTVHANQQQECYIEIWSRVTSLYSVLSGYPHGQKVFCVAVSSIGNCLWGPCSWSVIRGGPSSFTMCRLNLNFKNSRILGEILVWSGLSYQGVSIIFHHVQAESES